jgi:hypothetical protein
MEKISRTMPYNYALMPGPPLSVAPLECMYCTEKLLYVPRQAQDGKAMIGPERMAVAFQTLIDLQSRLQDGWRKASVHSDDEF